MRDYISIHLDEIDPIDVRVLSDGACLALGVHSVMGSREQMERIAAEITAYLDETAPALEPQFQVGDIVRLVQDVRQGPRKGMHGVIRHIGVVGHSVEFFEEFPSGHCGAGDMPLRPRRGYFFRADYVYAKLSLLELVERPNVPANDV